MNDFKFSSELQKFFRIKLMSSQLLMSLWMLSVKIRAIKRETILVKIESSYIVYLKLKMYNKEEEANL